MLEVEETNTAIEKKKCPDCIECRMCSESRCRVCRKGVHRDFECGLGSGFTYGQYLDWKKKRQ